MLWVSHIICCGCHDMLWNCHHMVWICHMLWNSHHMVWICRHILWICHMLWNCHHTVWICHDMVWNCHHMVWICHDMLWICRHMLWICHYILWICHYVSWSYCMVWFFSLFAADFSLYLELSFIICDELFATIGVRSSVILLLPLCHRFKSLICMHMPVFDGKKWKCKICIMREVAIYLSS